LCQLAFYHGSEGAEKRSHFRNHDEKFSKLNMASKTKTKLQRRVLKLTKSLAPMCANPEWRTQERVWQLAVEWSMTEWCDRFPNAILSDLDVQSYTGGHRPSYDFNRRDFSTTELKAAYLLASSMFASSLAEVVRHAEPHTPGIRYTVDLTVSAAWFFERRRRWLYFSSPSTYIFKGTTAELVDQSNVRYGDTILVPTTLAEALLANGSGLLSQFAIKQSDLVALTRLAPRVPRFKTPPDEADDIFLDRRFLGFDLMPPNALNAPIARSAPSIR